MSAARPRTRVPGVLYWAMGLPAIFALQYVPIAFVVPGDAAATAHRIASSPLVYRMGVLCGLAYNVFYVLLGLSLYDLLKEVDRRQARFMVALVTVSAALGVVNELSSLAALLVLGGEHFLSAFTPAQLDAIAFGCVRLHGAGVALDMAFWGLWLLPFGVLVLESGFVPRILGVCLFIGCLAYLAQSVAGIAFPAHRQAVAQLTLPFYAIGELPISLWLLIRGMPVRTMEGAPSSAVRS